MRNSDVSAEPEQTRQATRGDTVQIPTRYHRRRDGIVFPVEISATALTLEGRRVHIVAIRDITERHRAEEALRQAHQAEHRGREEAERRRLVAEALRGILAALNSSRRHPEVLDYIVAEACRLLGTDTGANYRLEAGRKLTLEASPGPSC